MRATAPGGGAVMHVTSHISNSLVSFSAHEMPIWSGFEADLQAEICANPRAVSDFGAAVLTRAVCEPHELAIPAAAVDVRGWRTGVHRYNLRRKSAHLKVAAYKVIGAGTETLFRNLSNPTEVKNENLQH